MGFNNYLIYPLENPSERKTHTKMFYSIGWFMVCLNGKQLAESRKSKEKKPTFLNETFELFYWLNKYNMYILSCTCNTHSICVMHPACLTFTFRIFFVDCGGYKRRLYGSGLNSEKEHEQTVMIYFRKSAFWQSFLFRFICLHSEFLSEKKLRKTPTSV